MCGILGYDLPGLSKNRRRLVAASLAIAMDQRGGHSWGLYLPDEERRLRKGFGRLAGAPVFGKLATTSCFMGHTRFATTGSVVLRNAHPFKYQGVIGAHNGMVYNHDLLNMMHGRRCRVDSEHIFRHIAEGAPLEEIVAYGAIEYVFESQPSTFFLAAFNGGSLAIARVGKAGVMWASTEVAIEAAANAAGLDIMFYRLDEDTVYAVENGKCYVVGDLAIGKLPEVRNESCFVD